MLTKKLAKCGNSFGALIPKTLRDLLGWTEETELEYKPEGNTLKLSPLQKKEQAIDLLFTNETRS